MKRLLTAIACACMLLPAWAALQPLGEMEILFLLQRDDELKNGKPLVVSVRQDSDSQATVLIQLNPPDGKYITCTFSLINGQWRITARTPAHPEPDTLIIPREPLEPAPARQG